MDTKVTINSKEYEISPLRCKHLRQVSAILKEQKENPISTLGFSSIDTWMPFIYDSLRIKNLDFKREELDEMTLTEFSTTWDKIVKLSGVTIISGGEVKPVSSTGDGSTAESPAPSAGVTPQSVN